MKNLDNLEMAILAKLTVTGALVGSERIVFSYEDAETFRDVVLCTFNQGDPATEEALYNYLREYLYDPSEPSEVVEEHLRYAAKEINGFFYEDSDIL